jgi:hypothetical protein
MTFTREFLNDAVGHSKKDESAFLLEKNILDLSVDNGIAATLLSFLGKTYKEYINKYGILTLATNTGVTCVRMQKTLPSEGYHIWHHELSSYKHQNRILAWTVYLNDVEDGGETEFLYQSKRVQCKQGRVVIWPAGFTHTHRGNPPLSGEKYILTGWIEYMPK